MKWKKDECGCCWIVEDSETTELLARVSRRKDDFDFDVRVFFVDRSKSLESAKALAEKVIKRDQK